jgi:hypothetical protein
VSILITTRESLTRSLKTKAVKYQCLTTQEAEIRRIMVHSQPGQIICETLSQKNSSQKRTGRVAQGIDLEFKTQYCKKLG